MLSYSTAQQPAAGKVAYWNDVISDVFTPLETKPRYADSFEAEVNCVRLGPLWLANVVSLPAKVQRLPIHIARAGEGKFFLHLQMRGSLHISQEGKDAFLNEGDLVLSDSSLPYTLEYEEACSTVVLIASGNDLKRHLPNPEQVVGVKLAGNQGLAHTTSVMLGSVWNGAKQDFDAELGTRIAGSILDVFATAWLATPGINVSESANSGSKRLMIRRYLEAHLRDPELSATAVAAAFGISVRYLHMLFPSEGETVCSYVLRRRLEQCAKQLADPLWNKSSITDIAFAWGFNNATHFGRVFRNHFNVSPREYRNTFASQRKPVPA
jgi:AraC-like DNA-binding protein